MANLALIGKDLGNYAVVSLIGEGGMGAVFEGRHRFLGRRVAIKVLHANLASNEAVGQRFFQEARAASEINHPGIVEVLDFGRHDDGSLYLVMERLGGESLAERLAGGPLAEGVAAEITCSVAEALEAAHAIGVVHRDIKPDNIFLTPKGVKVLDFGIAKITTDAPHTGTGAILGTPHYMAPEQAEDAKLVTTQTDVYALGVTLFQMVTGRRPFEGPPLSALVKILREAPPSPRSLAPISVEMERVILGCMEKDPARRPAGMAAVRGMLEPWRHGTAAPPAATPAAVKVAAPPVATTMRLATGEVTQQEAKSRTPGTRRTMIVVAAGAASLLVMGGGVMLFRHTDGNTPAPRLPDAGPRAAESIPDMTIRPAEEPLDAASTVAGERPDMARSVDAAPRPRKNPRPKPTTPDFY